MDESINNSDLDYWVNNMKWNDRKILKREPTFFQIINTDFITKCFRGSFMFRLFYNYNYISRFELDTTTNLFRYNGPRDPDLEVVNSVQSTIEQSIITEYAMSYMRFCPGSSPFPAGDHGMFLWNFFVFLRTSKEQINCIRALEESSDLYETLCNELSKPEIASTDSAKRFAVLRLMVALDIDEKMHVLFDSKKVV